LVHELLTLADSIFALIGTTVFRFNIFALAVGVGGQVWAHGPLELLHVSVVRLDPGLARESVRCRFVGVLWLVLLGKGQFGALIPIENWILLACLRWVLQDEGSALQVLALVLGLRGHAGIGVLLLNILVD
jgi:hypothetical protein